MKAYDPFARGPFPVGVRTIQALDESRDRLFPCEIWYPAGAEHAGQDLATATRDSFTDPSANLPQGKLNGPRGQLAVREAASEPGIWPLIVFSHSSGGPAETLDFSLHAPGEPRICRRGHGSLGRGRARVAAPGR